MDIFPGFDVKAAADRLNRINQEEELRLSERRRDAQREARRLAGLLVQEDPAIHTIRGFGSTFEEDRPYRQDSDIDLAIEGGEYFSLFRIVELSPFKVDLIDIGGQKDGFSALIRRRGVLLFENKGS